MLAEVIRVSSSSCTSSVMTRFESNPFKRSTRYVYFYALLPTLQLRVVRRGDIACGEPTESGVYVSVVSTMLSVNTSE
jgi:hypothetical protein